MGADALRRLLKERIAFMDEMGAKNALSPSQQRYRQALERQLRELLQVLP